MKKRFSHLKVNEGKLNIALTSEFRPLEEDPSVVLTVEHLRNGEIMTFMDMEDKSLDMPKLFEKKVKKVEGIECEGADGKPFVPTAKDIVAISDPDFARIVMLTATYILANGNLEEDEVKN